MRIDDPDLDFDPSNKREGDGMSPRIPDFIWNKQARTLVVAGCPVRNRAWIIERHLAAVEANNPDILFYLTGDNEDQTMRKLFGAQTDVHLELFRYDTGFPGWKRDGKGAERYHSANMARVRNKWAKEALRRWPNLTHLWNVDSDVLPATDVLSRLLAVDKPVVGAFVPIADGKTPIHMTHFVIDDPGGFKARRMGNEERQELPHPVTLLGGCYLIRRDALDEPLFWGPHPQGEDGFFGDQCRLLGLEMWVDPLASCQHLMTEDA